MEVLAHDNLAGSCRLPKMHTWDILKEMSTSSESQTCCMSGLPGQLVYNTPTAGPYTQPCRSEVCGRVLGGGNLWFKHDVARARSFSPECVVTENFRCLCRL